MTTQLQLINIIIIIIIIIIIKNNSVSNSVGIDFFYKQKRVLNIPLFLAHYRIYSRNSRTFFNQNFVSKFRVRDFCEETILRK